MSGKCFGCGKVGHHRDRCPDGQNKKASVKCFYCELTGHYQDGCPKKIADDKEKARVALLELEKEDRKWMNDYFPYSPREIKDIDSIKVFLNNSPLKSYQTLYLELTTDSGQVYHLTCKGGRFFVLPGQTSPLGRHLDGISILEFIDFFVDLKNKSSTVSIILILPGRADTLSEIIESTNTSGLAIDLEPR